MAGDPEGAERRNFERIPARIEVHFRKREDAARTLRAYSKDVSAGGLCVLTKRQHAVGAALEISMKIGEQAFQLHGVVAWVRGGAIGIRFENISPEDRERLAQLAQSLQEGPEGAAKQ